MAFSPIVIAQDQVHSFHRRLANPDFSRKWLVQIENVPGSSQLDKVLSLKPQSE